MHLLLYVQMRDEEAKLLKEYEEQEQVSSTGSGDVTAQDTQESSKP